MSKNENAFYCNECGARYPKWLGKCEDCGQWNTIVEDVRIENKSSHNASKIEFKNLTLTQEKMERKYSNISEFDRVLGGGTVNGSVILIGGDPGIGKSTLLLQVLSSLSQDYNCVYVSGEESAEQIKLRAARIGAGNCPIKLACETNISAILKSLEDNIDFLAIDSIQTLQSAAATSIPGSIAQVRACTYELINYAKTTNTTVFLIGHVTKDGTIAGPKVLEHMVDTVLYFEGEHGNAYRLLRAVKNRYGSCDELGIFEMESQGLVGVANPSSIFMTQRDEDIPGTTVFPSIEGTRPLLVEVQALASRSYFNMPRRTVVGWDINKLFSILAVIESKCKISFADRDVYLNVAGGLKISEPAGDLPIAVSLLSARSNCVISGKTCAFGEIGLIGEIRSVSRCSERIKEAEKLGFENIIIPANSHYILDKYSKIKVIPVKTLMDIVQILGLKNHA